MLDAPSPDHPDSIFISAPDGLRLHVRAYGRAPILVCPLSACRGLPGPKPILEALAQYLAKTDLPRRIFAFDYRGRGRSDHDPNWQNYDPRIEICRSDCSY